VDRPSLREIALRTGTDKEGVHSYTAAYERHLRHLRDSPIRLLEIGVGGYADPAKGGESLRMWKEYFPRAEIVGIDIHDKAALAEQRIAIVRGDQSDPDFLARVGREFGPFDVIIDDGSHYSAHVIASFVGLFPFLADGGIYVVEDLQTSYWETYGGSSTEGRAGTSMTFLHALVDGLNHAEFDVVGYVPSKFDEGIQSIAFYHNLAFVEKGANREPSTALPPHPRSRVHLARKSDPQPPRRARTPVGLARRVVARIRRQIGGKLR
jgi:hypothetical protein